MRWFNCRFITPPNLFVHLECWSVGRRDIKVTKGLWLIWHATIWVIWKKRNEKIFKGSHFYVDDIVEEIKVFS